VTSDVPIRGPEIVPIVTAIIVRLETPTSGISLPERSRRGVVFGNVHGRRKVA
jgi:hypothetical protein